MNFILWIIFGGLAGWIASLIMETDAQQGLLMNILVGIVGAVIGGYLMDTFKKGGAPGAERPTSIISFAVAVAGAIILIFIVGLII